MLPSLALVITQVLFIWKHDYFLVISQLISSIFTLQFWKENKHFQLK